MGKIIVKDGSYSELMLTEGATTIVDEDLNYEMKLPDWADADKIKMGQRFVLLNVNAMARVMLYGLMAVLPIESLTQMPDMFVIVGSDEQFDAFNHFWRLIGFLLGTEDRFNACGETVDETQSRLQSIVEDMLLPAWKDPFPACLPYSKITFEGVWQMFPTSHYESMLFLIKRVIGVPGFYLVAYESSEFKEENTKIFDDLSFCTKCRIVVDVVIFEYLSHIFIFRWIFNFVRLLIGLLDIYPILAIICFGKKYALVEVMKKKKN